VAFSAGIVPPLLAAPSQVLAPLSLLGLALWSFALGATFAIAPRLAAKKVASSAVSLEPRSVSALRGIALPLVVLAGETAYGLQLGVAPAWALVAVLIAGLIAAPRRALRAAAVDMMALIAVGFALAGGASEGHSALLVAGPAALALLARWVATDSARACPRRGRAVFSPRPRLSAALALLAVAAVGGMAARWAALDGAWRALAISDLYGPLPMPGVALFEPPVLPGAQHPSAASGAEALSGAAVAIDPLGRGTWIVDEENDEVLLLDSSSGARRSWAVGRWPEQVVVDRRGRAFVSVRQDGRITVIEPDGVLSAVEVGGEPAALALDAALGRLYVGLVTEKSVLTLDTERLAPLARTALADAPRALAFTPEGLAVLPAEGGRLCYLAGTVRCFPLPAGARRAWYGQALVPVGRDLLVVHAAVDTGVSHPRPTGGYGSSSSPVETVITVVRDGRPPVYPLDLSDRTLEATDITGAVWSDGHLYLSSRGADHLLDCRAAALARSKMDCTTVASAAGLAGVAAGPDGRLAALAAFDRELLIGAASRIERLPLGPGLLSPEVALGRKLFFAANDRRLFGSGFACATCHPDGRQDGLVWSLDGERRQTPILAGRILGTEPYNWRGTAPTLEDSLTQTVKRLRGSGLSASDTAALARFIELGLREPTLPRSPDPALVRRGEALFEDPAVGCAGCHEPSRRFTDGQAYDVGSASPEELAQMRRFEPGAEPPTFDVPSLRYLALSAPYFHDGAAASLEQLIDENRDRMGTTQGLSAVDRRALVAYLRSL
jgi:hypothetical protein